MKSKMTSTESRELELEVVSAVSLMQELASAEKKLEETEKRIISTGTSDAQQVAGRGDLGDDAESFEENDKGDGDDDDVARDEKKEESLPDRLERIGREAEDLLLVEDVVEYVRLTSESTGDVVDEAQSCERLAQILCRHPPGTSLHRRLFEEEYVPLHGYLRPKLIVSLRRGLQRSKYPSEEGCDKLLRECEEDTAGGSFRFVAACSEWLVRLALAHQQVTSHVEGTSASAPPCAGTESVIIELCRPFVERIRFHFIEQSPERPASSRIDRLPEWLMAYLKENVLEGGPWELISYGIAPSLTTYGTSLPMEFLNEIIRLIQWVLGERNFFRDAKIAGEGSTPLLLCNAIEQLLQFDHYVQSIVPAGQSRRVLSTMDIFVAGDDELLRWWLERERESVFSTLFDEDVQSSLANRVSPRAELFCSLVRSIRTKAGVFSFSGPYLSHVAAPLCLQFLDAVHESTKELRSLLSRRRPLSNADFASNVLEWIELINGTHMSASLLVNNMPENCGPSGAGEHDLVRFGHSLRKLEGGLIDEFAVSFVDTLLMDRARFAGYLMRCPHLLMSDADEGAADVADISPDLRETQRFVAMFLRICGEPNPVASPEEADDEGGESEAHQIAMYAPRLLRDRVLSLLGEKLLEVAIDEHGMTQEMLQPGCSVFARDISALFAGSLVPPLVLRLLEVAKVMSTDFRLLGQLGDALCGLAGVAPPLTEDLFAVDDRLYEEAMSMLRAKGFVWIQLRDALIILNRRKDLSFASAL